MTEGSSSSRPVADMRHVTPHEIYILHSLGEACSQRPSLPTQNMREKPAGAMRGAQGRCMHSP